MHMSRLHQNVVMSFGEKRKMGVLETPILCVHISLQSGFWERQVHSCSNIHIQPSHMPSWACWCGCTRVVMLINFSYYYPQMSLHDKYMILSFYGSIQLWLQYITIKSSIWRLVVIGIFSHIEQFMNYNQMVKIPFVTPNHVSSLANTFLIAHNKRLSLISYRSYLSLPCGML
jgi:hypothetical protein